MLVAYLEVNDSLPDHFLQSLGRNNNCFVDIISGTLRYNNGGLFCYFFIFSCDTLFFFDDEKEKQMRQMVSVTQSRRSKIEDASAHLSRDSDLLLPKRVAGCGRAFLSGGL